MRILIIFCFLFLLKFSAVVVYRDQIGIRPKIR